MESPSDNPGNSPRLPIKNRLRFFAAFGAYELRGDPSKTQAVLGWRHTTSFADLVQEMVDTDLKLTEQVVRKNPHD